MKSTIPIMPSCYAGKNFANNSMKVPCYSENIPSENISLCLQAHVFPVVR